MSKNHMSIPVVLGEKSFKDFLIFDTMKRQKRWKAPVSLAVCLYLLATLCFATQETYDWAATVGSILIVITVLIPTNYFRSFHASSKEQTKRMNLSSPRLVYKIHLENGTRGIQYYYPDEEAPAGSYTWDCITGAWRTKNAIYLYVTPEQALLIPDNNKSQNFEDIWNLITTNLDKPRIHNSRR